jgi:hypothetical protein
MTAPSKQTMRARAFGAVSIVVLASGFLAAAALSDSQPPPGTTVIVTVTTPVTAPPPDPAPPPTHVAKHAPPPKHHVQVTPKPTSPPTVPSAPSTGSVGGVQPPIHSTSVTRAHPVTHKRPASVRHRHKAKPKPTAKVVKPKRPVTTSAPPVKHTVATVPSVPRTAQPSTGATKNAGGIGEELTVLLLATVALVLLTAAVVFERRRRTVRAGAWEFGPTTELPVVAPVFTPPPARVTAPDPLAEDIEADDRLAEDLDLALLGAPLAAPIDGRCEVTAWRGYAKWRFYARINSGAAEVALLESRPFRAPGSASPEPTPAAKAAYTELSARLESEGWQRVDGGERWFESAFVRGDFATTAQPAPEPFATTEVREPDHVT